MQVCFFYRKFRGLDLLTVFHCVRDKSYCNFKDLIQKNMFEYDSFPKTFLSKMFDPCVLNNNGLRVDKVLTFF